MHDAPVLPGPRAVEHRDGATHVGRVGGTDTAVQRQLDPAAAAGDECAAEVVASHRVRGHRFAVARVHVLEVVVCVVGMLAVAGRVVVQIAAPAHLGSARPHRVPLKDNLLDLVWDRVRVRVRLRVRVRVRVRARVKVTCFTESSQCAALAFHRVLRAMMPFVAWPPPSCATPGWLPPVEMSVLVPSKSLSKIL
jgi:hypothetical protein